MTSVKIVNYSRKKYMTRKPGLSIFHSRNLHTNTGMKSQRKHIIVKHIYFQTIVIDLRCYLHLLHQNSKVLWMPVFSCDTKKLPSPDSSSNGNNLLTWSALVYSCIQTFLCNIHQMSALFIQGAYHVCLWNIAMHTILEDLIIKNIYVNAEMK